MLPTAKFQVLVEPDGTTGSYILFDKQTLMPLVTIDKRRTVRVPSANGAITHRQRAAVARGAKAHHRRVRAEVHRQHQHQDVRSPYRFADSAERAGGPRRRTGRPQPRPSIVANNTGGATPEKQTARATPNFHIHGRCTGVVLDRAASLAVPSRSPNSPATPATRPTPITSAALSTLSMSTRATRRRRCRRPGCFERSIYTYQDAAGNDITGNLTDVQHADIKAV